MKIRKQKNKQSNKKIYLYIFAGVILISAAYIATAYAKKLPPFAANTETIEYKDGVNLERTDTEKAASDALQEDPGTKLDNSQTDTPAVPEKDSATGKQNANVMLTTAGIYNGTVNAGGMVTNVIEESGRCIYVFTKGSEKLTKETTTLVNPTSTTCKAISFPANELPSSGKWTVALDYDSTASQGTSNSMEIIK
jgi:hypothetical protein